MIQQEVIDLTYKTPYRTERYLPRINIIRDNLKTAPDWQNVPNEQIQSELFFLLKQLFHFAF